MISRMELRKRAGLRLTDLARAAGVSIPSVSLWERGLLNLNTQAVEKIAVAIDSRIREVPVFDGAVEIEELISAKSHSGEIVCEQ